MIRILSAARTVVVFGVLLQVAGFAKMLVIANYFGAGPLLDAYYLGLIIPTFLASVSAGILQTGFVPVYVATRARGADSSAKLLGNAALTWTVLALSAAAALLALLRAVGVPMLSHGSSSETRAALQSAFMPLMWMAPLQGLADGGAMLLNADGRFAAAAAAPLLNVLVGVIVLVGLHNGGVDALVWSLLTGLGAQALLVLTAIRASGFALRPQLAAPAAGSGLLGKIALPVLIANVLGNLVPAFVQMLSARAGTGAISAMGYASRLHNSLVQAIVMSVSVVLLPHFARLMAQQRHSELRATLRRVFAATLLFSGAAVVLVATAGPLAIRLLLQRGNFTPADAQLVWEVWLALTLGLFGATWGIFLVRLLQAQQLAWVIVATGCVSVVINLGLALAFLPLWGVVGVALANSLAYTLLMWLIHLYSRRTFGALLDAGSFGFVGRALLANLVAYGLALWLQTGFPSLSPWAVITAQFIVVALANLAVARTAPLHLTVRAMLAK
jgi:putative peptidoglycan lipid II flippase